MGLAQTITDLVPDFGLTSKIIHDLITEHSTEQGRLIDSYNRMIGEGIPISDREAPSNVYDKINNKLIHDYPTVMVKTKSSYLAGIPPSLNYEPTYPNVDMTSDEATERRDAEADVIQKWLDLNEFADLTSESTLRSGNEGYSVWHVFIDPDDGVPKYDRMEPWETIFIWNRTRRTLDYVLRYYTMTVSTLTGGGDFVTEQIIFVEWWDTEQVTYYRQLSAGSAEYIEEEPTEERPNPQAHPFQAVPWIKVRNNGQDRGDWDAVVSLIDGQDQVKSNLANDIEQFTSAILKFLGFTPTHEMMGDMEWSGGLTIPEGADVDWLIKEITKDAHEYFLTANDKDIWRLAGIPDFDSEGFSGNTPIIQVRMKIFKMEALAIIAQNKITRALNEMMKMVVPFLNLSSTAMIDPAWIKWTWTRNLPVNTAEEATTLATLKGVVSEETRLATASFIPDPKAEIERMDRDQESGAGFIDLDAVETEETEVEITEDEE